MWFDTNKERYENECALLTQRGFVLDAVVLAKEQVVQFEGRSRIEPDRRLIVRFPDTFPSFPPRVIDTTESPLLRRHHAPSNRQFCLFGPGNARWSATSNSGAALDEADELIKLYRADAPTPASDTVPEPASASIWCGRMSIFVPPPLSTLEGIDDRAPLGTCTLLIGESDEDERRGVLVRADLGSENLHAPPQFHSLCGANAQKREGRLLYLSQPPTAQDINDAAAKHFREMAPRRRRANMFLGIVFPEQSGDVHGQRLGWMFAVTRGKGDQLEMVRAFPYSHEERNARIPHLSGLDKFKIVVVGCGCLGSKIAVGLAASGAKEFVLIDKDFIEPYNSVRHELGVSSFGVSKAKALKKRLFDVNPATAGQVTDLYYDIGAINTTAEEKAATDHLASADLVIDATGLHGVSRWINEVCTENKTMAVYVSVTNGAWSGEIVRITPGEACWACWNKQYEHRLPPGEKADAIYPPGCDQPSFTGSTYDTGIVANLACAVAVESLLKDCVSVLQYPHPYVCWQARDANGLPLLKVETLPIDQRSNCPFCNGA